MVEEASVAPPLAPERQGPGRGESPEERGGGRPPEEREEEVLEDDAASGWRLHAVHGHLEPEAEGREERGLRRRVHRAGEALEALEDEARVSMSRALS